MRRKTGSTLVKGAILAAIATVVVSNEAVSVKAEQNEEAVDFQESAPEEVSVLPEAADNGAEETVNTEREADEEPNVLISTEQAVAEAESTQTQSEQVQEAAKTVVSEVTESMADVDKVQENVETVAQDITEVDDTVENAITEGNAALEAVQGLDETQKEALADNADQAQSEVEALNERMENRTETIINDDGSQSKDIIIGEIQNEEGEKDNILLNEYMQDQVNMAAAETDKAKISLENALAEGNDITTEKLQGYADEAKAAADAANNVKTEAEDKYSKARRQVLEEIKKYNAYATAYGYELIEFEGSIPKYTDAELLSKGLNFENASKDVATVGNVTVQIAAQLEVVEQAKESLETAKTTCDEIQKTAEEALDAAKQAAELVEESAQKTVNDAVQSDKENLSDFDKVVTDGVASAAGQAAEDANSAVEAAAEAVAGLGEQISNVKENIDNVNKAIENTESVANNAINGLTEAVSNYRPDVTKLQSTLSDRMLALNLAKEKLATVQNSANSAQSFADWMESLTNDQTIRAYGQLKKDGSGFAEENVRGFDETDADVESRKVFNFKEVTANGTPVKVPYSVYRSYVDTMHDRTDANGNLITYTDVMKKHKADGLGAAINSDAKMPEIYWAVDEKGNITGDPYLKNVGDDVPKSVKTGEPITEGRYFMGYTFKYEADSFYHIDGYMVNYKPSETPDEPVNPDVPVTPDEPINPDVPVTPDEPVNPDVPVTPDEPVNPDVPVTPDEPVNPDVPVTPDEPINPDVPVTPDIPGEPENPVPSTPDNSNVVINDTAPATSSEPATTSVSTSGIVSSSGSTTVIASEPTPLASVPEKDTTTINDIETPLAGPESASVTIDDAAVPLAEAPATGDNTKAKWPWAAAGTGLIAAAGIVNIFSRKRKTDK